MCVGLPARIVGIDQDGTALVDASGAKAQDLGTAFGRSGAG